MDTEALEGQDYEGVDLSNDFYFTSRLHKEDPFEGTMMSQLEHAELEPDFGENTDP